MLSPDSFLRIWESDGIGGGNGGMESSMKLSPDSLC